MRLLLLSSSRTPEDETFLAHAEGAIREHFAGLDEVVFLPFAAVSFSWDDYRDRVAEVFEPLGIGVLAAHSLDDPAAALAGRGILVGGGNTFRLVQEMHARALLGPVREAVRDGSPYMGWSAGSNLACPGLYTSNDMPIVEPASFEGLDLVSFQINPHFTDAQPPGHRGETRRQRIEEFLMLHPETTVVGLPEGAWLEVADDVPTVRGKAALRFRKGEDGAEVAVGDSVR